MSVDERKEALLRHCEEHGRVCPQPGKWHELWQLIGAPERDGLSPPLILGGWAFSSNREKRERFRSHVSYAAENGLLNDVEQFISRLGEEDWHSCGADRLDWNFGDEIAREHEERN